MRPVVRPGAKIVGLSADIEIPDDVASAPRGFGRSRSDIRSGPSRPTMRPSGDAIFSWSVDHAEARCAKVERLV